MLVWQPVLNKKDKGSVTFPVGNILTAFSSFTTFSPILPRNQCYFLCHQSYHMWDVRSSPVGDDATAADSSKTCKSLDGLFNPYNVFTEVRLLKLPVKINLFSTNPGTFRETVPTHLLFGKLCQHVVQFHVFGTETSSYTLCISVADPGEGPGRPTPPPLFLDQTYFFETTPLPLMDDHPTPVSEGLDPPLYLLA